MPIYQMIKRKPLTAFTVTLWGGGKTTDRSAQLPIKRFLAGQVFDPEALNEMSIALERVCDSLRLRVVDDAMTRLVAEKIIELAERGVRDSDKLHLMALTELNARELGG